uniref:Uncharacterized protein n=2 Tax=Cryptomonas curvata TaxID=233186 RepID=A0A7S0QK36_9CRYP|mmetsp:Transcript_30909/g.64819  ORF Transcript_30909/g.64819 Transcript_30909/m.64819 type:complete len:113 (+) Transcript_30909:327-665(+)
MLREDSTVRLKDRHTRPASSHRSSTGSNGSWASLLCCAQSCGKTDSVTSAQFCGGTATESSKGGFGSAGSLRQSLRTRRRASYADAETTAYLRTASTDSEILAKERRLSELD